jgi:hypothetical protein
MGILLSREHDLMAFTRAYEEAFSIIKNATKMEAAKNKIVNGSGYCIRCSDVIKFNLLKPLCLSCFRQWSKFSNKLYTEKYCHRCGNETKSCLNVPVCQTCESCATN